MLQHPKIMDSCFSEALNFGQKNFLPRDDRFIRISQQVNKIEMVNLKYTPLEIIFLRYWNKEENIKLHETWIIIAFTYIL